MLGPTTLREAPLEVQKLMLQLQDYGIKDIARRIAKYGAITGTAEYQLTTMMEQDIFGRDFKKEIQRILGLTDQQINDIFGRAAEANYIYDKRAFQDRGIPFTPFEDNYFIQALANNIISVTQGKLHNITNSLGFAIRVDGKLVFQEASQFYQSQLDIATTSVVSGMKTFDQALRDAIYKMADSGMRTVNYASVHTDRIDVAARRAMMGGMRDLTNAQSEYNASIMQTTCYEISWHGGYRPSHRWGGRRFDTQGLLYPTEQQLYEMYTSPDGHVGTLNDYNCYHEKYAVFPDTPPTYTDDQLNQMEKQENETREYEGKEYNSYDARQQQRYLERVMRRQQSIIAGLEGATENAPEDSELRSDLQSAIIKMKQLRKQYKDFSKAMDLDPEWERLTTS